MRPKGWPRSEEALAGARDMIAERVSDDAMAREKTRALYLSKAVVRSKVLSDKQESGRQIQGLL